MKYVSVTNPRWGAPDKSQIDCNVVFELEPAIPATAEIPAVPATEAVPATLESAAVPASPGTPAVPATPGKPAILSDPWPFTAHPNDAESHSQDIFADCVAGKYGPIADYVATFSATMTKSECSSRIYAIASAAAQMNMTAYIASGTATDADKSAFINSLSWVQSMRAACASLIAASDMTFAQDGHWPVCPADVLALAAKF